MAISAKLVHSLSFKKFTKYYKFTNRIGGIWYINKNDITLKNTVLKDE